jgi:hypothetical protein
MLGSRPVKLSEIVGVITPSDAIQDVAIMQT